MRLLVLSQQGAHEKGILIPSVSQQLEVGEWGAVGGRTESFGPAAGTSAREGGLLVTFGRNAGFTFSLWYQGCF